MYIQSYKELIVWQKAIQVVKGIFLLTESFPKSEIYGITSQMRRASVSIPSNIAEGFGRKSQKEYSQFYAIAYGSGLELETQLIIAKELKLGDSQALSEVETLLVEVLRMLNVMTKNLAKSSRTKS